MMDLEQKADTSLSPMVKNLLCSIGIGVWTDQERGKPSVIEKDLIDENGFLSIQECFKYLELNEDMPRDSFFFQRAVFKLSPVFRESEKFWMCRELDEVLESRFKWTGNAQLFHDCLSLLKQNCLNGDILALLLLCAGVEHAFRNFFMTEEVQCPMLLKDILISDLLQDYLGKDAVELFHILLGPPISMNLRNVAWHGFLSEGEILPRYAYFLLTLMASLSPKTKLSNNIVERLPKTSMQYFPLSKVDMVMASFPDFPGPCLQSMKNDVLDSWMTCEQNKNLIGDVFDLYAAGKYGLSSVQGFPLLEHSLRRHFVKVNNCMHRLLTAESTTLYTTYEEILDCHLPDGSENKLICDLGEPFLDLLHDLLVYPNGPRARDRLGHGEADINECSPSLSSCVIICLCYLAGKGRNGQKQAINELGIPDLTICVDNYESHFHPVAELKERIQAMSIRVTKVYSALRTDPDLQHWHELSQTEIFTKSNSNFLQIKKFVENTLNAIEEQWPSLWRFEALKAKLTASPFGDIHENMMECLQRRVSTLHRWQKKEKYAKSSVSESEIIGLMHRIVSEMLMVADQTRIALQQRQDALDNRVLRSRQRDNMKRLIHLIPNLTLATNHQVIVLTWLFHNLNQTDQEYLTTSKKIQISLKSMLQIGENLRTYTSSEHNKWTKADDIILTLAQFGMELIGHFGKNVS